MGENSVTCLLGQPALVQLVEKAEGGKTDKEKKALLKKIESQCQTFNGKGKLTLDDFYSVIKVQVGEIIDIS